MKAFTLHPKGKRDLLILLEQLKNYGECNCNFNTFCKIYNEWHMVNFPGCEISTSSATFRSDWFTSFINFIANYEIPGGK